MNSIENAKNDLEFACSIIEQNMETRLEYGETGSEIYSYETESYSSYLDENPVNIDSSLLLGGSCDKIFTSIAMGGKKVTGFDCNPLVPWLYELKKAAIMTETDPNNILSYFIYDENKKTAFAEKYFEKYVKNLSPNAEYFWSHLYDRFTPRSIAINLTAHATFGTYLRDENEAPKAKAIASREIPYLSENNYHTLREKLQDDNDINILTVDAKELSKALGDETFTYINMSSLPYFLSPTQESYLNFLKKDILPHLKTDGKITLANLYSYSEQHFKIRDNHKDWETNEKLKDKYGTSYINDLMISEHQNASYHLLKDVSILNPKITYVPTSLHDDSNYPFDAVLTYQKTK